jgi:hypothetical protein
MRVPKRIAGREHTAQRRSLQQEKELAKRISGRTVKGSGRGNEKGDVRVEGIVRIEAKTTTKSSFSVTSEMIQKIELASVCSGECPAIVIEFLNKNGKPIHEVAVVPMWVLNALTSK